MARHRDMHTMALDLGHELIIDNFAGGGGTSEGLEQAFGRPVDIAINHDPEALAMHARNHPHTLHLLQSVWDVNPIVVTKNRPVGLVWLSPDCKHFSKAKGGTPVATHIRGLAWVGMRWVALCKPRVLMLENVEEFQDWGPVIVDAAGQARPDPKRKGVTFTSFVRQLRAHGYTVDWRELRACDHGAPTIRKRLFLVARRDGLPIAWPDATHAEPDSREVLAGKLLPYRTAAECIDWSIEGRSLWDRERPLATNTQRRVAKGLWRHVLTSASPFIVRTDMHKSNASCVYPSSEPLRTPTTSGGLGLVAPAVVPMRGTSEAHLGGHDVQAPLSTVSAGGHHHGLAAAHITKFRTGSTGQAMDAPMPTVTANSFVKRPGGAAPLGIVSAHLTHMTHQGERTGRPADAPLATITTAKRGEQALIGANLITIGYGERPGQDARAQEVPAPLGTVVAANKHALVAACLEQANGGFYDGDGRPVVAPVSTITATGSNQRLITAYCVKYYSSGGQDQHVGGPMHTLPTKGRMGLVQTVQVPADCLTDDQRVRARQCAELLREHLPEHFPEPADLVLLWHADQWWALVDITLRMLKPPELFAAQGFPGSYVIHEIPDPALLFVDGVQVADPLAVPRIPLTATAQVRMCGNSVSPPMAKALALSNFAHEAMVWGRAAA